MGHLWYIIYMNNAASQKPRDRHLANQGMNWIRPEKRLSIYLRDGLACCYCGAAVEDGTKLTLDHLVPHSKGGSNEATNLVTCCLRCNSSRGNRPVEDFVSAVASYLNHGVLASDILCHIRQTTQRPIDVKSAKEIMTRRGGFTSALKGAAV